MKYKIPFTLLLIPTLFIGSANANWEYPNKYVRQGAYSEDGSKFVLSFRGGASIASGTINNDIGTLSTDYYVDTNTGEIISNLYYSSCVTSGGCADFVYAGTGDIAKLPAAKNFDTFAFAAGASIGFTVPNNPQWRMELGWDHIAETEYNQSPLFSGNLELTGSGYLNGESIPATSGGAYSSVSTDIASIMMFYDFFDGIEKNTKELIPYIGFGMGYADSTTKLILSDLYGDLSSSADLVTNYGELDNYSVLQFYTAEKSNSNIAGILALGASYGFAPGAFLDLGVRFTYVPDVKWVLANSDATRNRDWFSASDIIYTNIMAGVRFEF